ncbi:MAG: hypothetical protein JRH15_01825 [Deltaproteobacteria bacterium]|nr:hypothetical protein [Deltaproteobacteria bacterium]
MELAKSSEHDTAGSSNPECSPGFFRRIGNSSRKVWTAAAPGPHAWKGATFGVLVAASLMWVLTSYYFSYGSIFDPVTTLVMFIIGVLLVGILSGTIMLIGRMLKVFPLFYKWAAMGAVFLTLFSFTANSLIGILSVYISMVIVASLIGAGISAVFREKFKHLSLTKRVICFTGLLLGITGLFYGSYFLMLDGFDAKAPVNSAAGIHIKKISLPDPSLPGDYKVLSMTYGSGTDKKRTEYGKNADIVTKTVDGSVFIKSWKGTLAEWDRVSFWGFDVDELPLNARVWYPDGKGLYPLILIVHGHHAMREFSDPGYEYIGTMLASNGFIVVSVDQNFFGGSWSDILTGYGQENDARGWMLLEHLRLWRDWNKTDGNLFYQKVDMNQIGLMGHSRGGEAAAVAAAFNNLSCYPDDATYKFNYGFNIRSIVYIAGVAGLYKPAGQDTVITDVNYFAIHGTNDADLPSFQGTVQYDKVKFTGDAYNFKAALYVHGANHGQFNSIWGRKDVLGIPFLLNRKIIMPFEEQIQIAKVYFAAFFKATLRQETGYLPIFRDYRTSGGWLPNTIYLNQFADSDTHFLSTFEEDIDVTSTTVPGGSLKGENLTIWRENPIKLKWGDLVSNTVFLGWHASIIKGPASYTINVPTAFEIDNSSVFVFSLADANENPVPEKYEDLAVLRQQFYQEDKSREPIDLTIAVEDVAGNTARLPLASFSRLQPQIKGEITKAAFLNPWDLSEPVFQSFEFPLSNFSDRNPDFDPAALKTVRLVFDRTPKGVIILDNIGFRQIQTNPIPSNPSNPKEKLT